MSLKIIERKVLSGERLTEEDAILLFKSDDLLTIGELAHYVSRKKNSDYVYFVVNRHINPSNICINRCRFCAFSKDKGDSGAYTLTIDEILERTREAMALGATEIHIVGGLHPELPYEFYIEMLRVIKREFPAVHLQAFTAVEIDYFSRISGKSIGDVLLELKEAGLGSLPGGGAEIFEKRIRERICPEKITGERWLEIMRTAHRLGIRSNATMLYGHLEDYESRVHHLSLLRALQDETGGFQAFIPLAFHPKNTRINGANYTTAIDDLKTIAVSRLFLDNFPHIKSFWIMLGKKIAQLSLLFGSDDLDGTVVEEKITHSAGAMTDEFLPKGELIRLIRKAGKIPVERDTLYRIIRIYDGADDHQPENNKK